MCWKGSNTSFVKTITCGGIWCVCGGGIGSRKGEEMLKKMCGEKERDMCYV